MRWQRISPVCFASGNYRVSRVCVDGEWLWEAWHRDGESKRPLVARLKTETEAKTLCEVDAGENDAA